MAGETKTKQNESVKQMKLNTIGTNQNEVTLGNGSVIFFSYNTPVAAIVEGSAYRTEKKWSVTTSRHINQWLDGRPAETKPQAWFDTLSA